MTAALDRLPLNSLTQFEEVGKHGPRGITVESLHQRLPRRTELATLHADALTWRMSV